MTPEDSYFTAPSGVQYRLPAGEEVERIDGYITRMGYSTLPDKYRADAAALRVARAMLVEERNESL